MLGDLSSFDQGTGEYKENRVLYTSAFFQDDYKIHPRLSLNIGVRYEPTPPWHEVVGRIQIFRLDAYQQGLRTTQFDNAPPGSFFRGDPGIPDDGTYGDYNNVGFRGGAAWDIRGDGKTSLRGGWGMFYDQHIRGGFNNGAVNAPPWSIRVNVTEPVGPWSDPYRGRNDFDRISLDAIGRRDAPFPAPVEANSYDEQFETPLTYNYNLTLEREVLTGWMARAAYVGSKVTGGRHTISLNPAIYVPGATTGTTDARRALQPYGEIPTYVQDRWSKYNAMQLTLNRRFSRGFTINSNYTLANVVGNFGDELIPYFMDQDPALVEGRLGQMRRHRFVTSWVLDIPDLGTDNTLVRAVVNGWQITGIGTVPERPALYDHHRKRHFARWNWRGSGEDNRRQPRPAVRFRSDSVVQPRGLCGRRCRHLRHRGHRRLRRTQHLILGHGIDQGDASWHGHERPVPGGDLQHPESGELLQSGHCREQCVVRAHHQHS